MFHSFSVQKSANVFRVLFAGVVASLLAVQLPPTIASRDGQTAAMQLADSSSSTPRITEQESNPALWLVAAVAGGTAVGFALKARNGSNTTSSNSPFQNQHSSTISLNQGSRKLQKELMLLLHEDREAAKRLLTQAQFKYPNRTVDWYFEKVIYDLERDRGGL